MENNIVKIYNPKGEDWLGTQYEINGKQIENVKAVDFRVAVDEVPQFTFETYGLPNIEMNGEVRFCFTPETVQEAAKIICHEAKTDEALMDAFVSSIESILSESEKIGQCADGAAREIAERILGV